MDDFFGTGNFRPGFSKGGPILSECWELLSSEEGDFVNGEGFSNRIGDFLVKGVLLKVGERS